MPRVLLADDDDELRAHIAKRLVDAGYDVREARDGCEVLEWLAVGSSLGFNEPDVFVLDANMPNPSGVDLLVALRAAGIATPIVLVTATSTQELREAVDEQGGALVLEKPFTTDSLQRVLANRERWSAYEPPRAKIVGED
jgi:DNA-binding response OmpR family regulator